jgi:hypothetical protein
VDNGRVIGYDNAHGYHHRHFMGQLEHLEFRTYEDLNCRFLGEIQELWRQRIVAPLAARYQLVANIRQRRMDRATGVSERTPDLPERAPAPAY